MLWSIRTSLATSSQESEDAIEALHDRIWTVVVKVMEDAGKPADNGLRITMCLVDMLPTIPIHLAFHSSTPGLTGFVAEVYAPSLSSDQLLWISLMHHHQKVIGRH